jgi:hypothetical protein
MKRRKTKKLKPIIADAFKRWEEQASQEEKKKFCDDANNLALSLRIINPIKGES